MYATPERGVAYMQLWNNKCNVPELHVCNSGTGSDFRRLAVLIRGGIKSAIDPS